MSTPGVEVGWLRAILAHSLLLDASAAVAGVRRVDLDCLLILFLSGDSTTGELGAALGLSSGGVSGVLDRLERDALISRCSDAGDRRRVVVGLTNDGSRLLDEATAPTRAALSSIFGSADTGEVALLGRITEPLAAAADRAKVELRGLATPGGDDELEGDYSVPLGSLTRGALAIDYRFQSLRISPGDSDRLFAARLTAGARVRASGGDIVLQGKRSPIGPAPRGAIELNPSVPWSVRIGGGALKLDASLGGLQIEDFEIAGGSNDITVVATGGGLNLRIVGGATHLDLHVSGGVGVAIVSRGGVSSVEFDGEHRRLLGRGEWHLPPGHGRALITIGIRGGSNTIRMHSNHR